jgi:MoxR-like ATPase
MTNPLHALPPLADARTRLQAVEDGLNAAFAERRGEVRSLMTALVAGEHVLLLGPPGTAKSALTKAFCAATIQGPFFEILMTKYTVPEEVCGPLSLAGLEHDRYERVTAGYLPAASGAFLDEIGKANSSILNSLLTILNEREFDNGGQRVKIPLEIVVGASNELFTDDALRALDDRFLLRHWVEPVKNRSAVKSLLQGRGAPKVAASLQTGDLEVLRAAAQAVTVTDEVADAMLDLKDSLNREHGIQCSDRRWRKMVELVCARAAIRGGAQTEKADLLVLADSIWRTIDERPTVQAVVSKAVSPALGDALRLKDAAMEIVAKVDKAGKGSQATAALATASGEVTKLVAQIKALNGAATDPQIQAIVKEVEAVKQELAKTAAAALGLTF